MTAGLHLAWLQLTRGKGHFAAATAGVAFAVTLMLGQIGLRDSLLETSTRFYERMQADIVMTSWEYQFQQGTGVVPQRRIAQALAVPGVASCTPVRIGWAGLKNPVDFQVRQIVLIGIPAKEGTLVLPGMTASIRVLQEPDTYMFDAGSRAMYGPLAELLRGKQRVPVEVSYRRGEIAGLFELGPGFGTNGNMITSEETFRRVTSPLAPPLPSLALIRLEPGAGRREVGEALRQSLPRDVRLLMFDEFLEQERQYWLRNSPIGIVFTVGLLIALVVGSVVVYQILYSDVSHHLWEYATMKSMGYRDSQLFGLVILQAILVSIMGFIPGSLMAHWLFSVTQQYTLLPLGLTPLRLGQVYGLTFFMCCLAGCFAMRALRSADPAEIF